MKWGPVGLFKTRKIKKRLGFFILYILGFFAWVIGLYCLEPNSNSWSLSRGRAFRHFLKLFGWTVTALFFFRLMGLYRAWIFQAQPGEIATAFLIKSVVFLYVKVFWPRIFPRVLPGLHLFFCPQCFQRQTFRFMPVSTRFGFFVTYLCGYCSCLVDSWGNQLFFPSGFSLRKIYPVLAGLLSFSMIVILCGFWFFDILWSFL